MRPIELRVSDDSATVQGVAYKESALLMTTQSLKPGAMQDTAWLFRETCCIESELMKWLVGSMTCNCCRKTNLMATSTTHFAC